MDQVEEIKQKNDIVELIGSYLELKKAGANYKAPCPFHQEKDPSFMVNPNRQIFKCFGCGESGDVYTFVEKMEGVDFPGALKILADRAGVKLKKIDQKDFDDTKELYQINELATKFFQYLLNEEGIGKKARKYLKEERELEDKIIKKFRIGYAPNAWNNLMNFLTKKGYKKEQILKAGLVIENRDKKSTYDRFRGRIMIPIINPADRVIGFTSRILPEFDDGKTGKYINSPETPIFNKSRVLFGKNFANKEIRQTKEVILVEGQLDVISSFQHGFTNTIATSGTSLTQDQIDLISRIADKIIFAFDSDQAGQEATKKGIDLALASDLEVRVALIPGKFGDVDDVLRADPKMWKEAVKNSKEIIEYYFDKLIPKNPTKISSNKKREIVKELVEQIKKTKDPVIQGDWINKLSELLNIDDDFINQAMNQYSKGEGSSYKKDKDSIDSSTTSTDKEERLLGLVMTFEDFFDKMEDKLDAELFKKKKLKDLYQAFKKKGKNNLVTESQRKLADSLIMDVEKDYVDEDLETARSEFDQLIARIKDQNRDQIKSAYAQKIKEAEKDGDIDKVKELIEKFQKIIK